VLRPETEWVEILETGNGILADADPEKLFTAFLHFRKRTESIYPALYGDGHAAEHMLHEVLQHLPPR
jgi:UDP-GlcNAc3NAcA epimerase